MVATPETLVGKRIHLELAELGAEGFAEVTAVEACPAVGAAPGRGYRLVTGTFAHQAANVVDLSIEGRPEPIGCTANHPFWSETRRRFVPAGELFQGETLRTASGDLRAVVGILPRAAATPVHNLEIDAEHVYYVSDTGVLVHNAYGGGFRQNGLRNLAKMGLRGVKLRGRSLKSGTGKLLAAGFKKIGLDRGRTLFENPTTGAKVAHDSGAALAGGQKPHWHIEDSGGRSFTGSGRQAPSSGGHANDARHIPAAP